MSESLSNMDYNDIATKIFSKTRHKATQGDISRLASNMALLESRGLTKLNKRLIDSQREGVIWATIAEHNFAVILVSHHPLTTPINYEPDIGLQCPPDFKVDIDGSTYWIQMKDLSLLERENRQNKIIRKIKDAAKAIPLGKCFACTLSDGFKEDRIPELIEFIKSKVSTAAEQGSMIFDADGNQRAEIRFWLAEKSRVSNLTMVYAGDFEAANLTGLDTGQMRQSLRRAAEAFEWKTDQKNINLVVMEADGKDDIDICDAFFGTEYDELSEGQPRWDRQNDGLFKESELARKVAGIISLKRKPELCELSVQSTSGKKALTKKCVPISDYHRILYINDKFTHLVDKIQSLIRIDLVVDHNLRPPMGGGDFATP